MPILDNVFSTGNAGFSSGPRPPNEYTPEEVVEIVKSVYVSGAERDIMLGDAVDIFILRNTGQLDHEVFNLKLD